MALLVEITINGTLARISNLQHNLTNSWAKRIVSIDPIVRQVSTTHGGYCALGYGSIQLSPELFENDFPPPIECDITLKFTESTEAAAVTLFTGVAHLSLWDREVFVYELWRDDYSTVIADSTAFTSSDTLLTVFTWACNAARLNLTLNSTLAESPSPDIYYTTSGDELLISFLDKLAAAHGHIFYISGSTLYLIDCNEDNGSRTLARWERQPSYMQEAPITMAKTTNYYQTSSYGYGAEITVLEYDNTQATIETYLSKILGIHHKRRANIVIPMEGTLPVPGEKVSWRDQNLNIIDENYGYIRLRNITYDFNRNRIVLDGEGTFFEPIPDVNDSFGLDESVTVSIS